MSSTHCVFLSDVGALSSHFVSNKHVEAARLSVGMAYIEIVYLTIH